MSGWTSTSNNKHPIIFAKICKILTQCTMQCVTEANLAKSENRSVLSSSNLPTNTNRNGSWDCYNSERFICLIALKKSENEDFFLSKTFPIGNIYIYFKTSTCCNN